MFPRRSSALFAFLVLLILWAWPSAALAQACHFKSACWTTANRPAAPVTGQFGLNTTNSEFETYSGRRYVASATINNNGGPGCTGTTQTLIGTGGTGDKFIAFVPVVGGALSGTVTISDGGYYSTDPSPTVGAGTTGAAGCSSSPTLDLTMANSWGLNTTELRLPGTTTVPSGFIIQGNINYNNTPVGPQSAWIYQKFPQTISGIANGTDAFDGNVSPFHFYYVDQADLIRGSNSPPGILNNFSLGVVYQGAAGTRQLLKTNALISTMPDYTGLTDTYSYQYVDVQSALQATNVSGGGGTAGVTAATLSSGGTSCTATGTAVIVGTTGVGTKWTGTVSATSGSGLSGTITVVGGGSYSTSPSSPDTITVTTIGGVSGSCSGTLQATLTINDPFTIVSSATIHTKGATCSGSGVPGVFKFTGTTGTGAKFTGTADGTDTGLTGTVDVTPVTIVTGGAYSVAPGTPETVTVNGAVNGGIVNCTTSPTLNLTTSATNAIVSAPAYRTSLFGYNPHVRLTGANSKNYYLTTPGEFDISVADSASTSLKYGLLIELTTGSASNEVRGTFDDAGIELGNFGTTGTKPSWKYGISFGGYSNNFPFDTDSTLIGAQQRGIGATPTMNAKYGVDFSAVTFQATNSAPLRMPLQTPASGTEACDQGAVRWDASYFYACTSANVWKRAALYLFGGTYTAYGAGSATHTFQTATNVVRVIGCGAGGGGGSGAKQTSGSAASGGSGGGGGGCFDKTFLKSELGSTSMKVNVGTGGPGGGVPGAGPIKGNVGTAGSAATCISSAATCTGTIYAVGGFGGGGAGGQLAAASASGGGGCSYLATVTGSGTNTTNGATGADGTPGNPCFFGTAGVAGAVGTSTTTIGMGGAGGGGSNGAQGPIGSSMLTGASGGGAGGGIIAAGPSSAAGGNGGYVSTAAAGAAAGGAAGTNNGAGGVTPVAACMGATGAGGGGGNHAGNAGNGGNGIKGSGGGGGGSSLNANTPGTGGNGGDGFLCIFEYE